MNFNEIVFSPAETEILKLMQQELSIDDLIKIKNVSRTTITACLNDIYRKTKDVVPYGSAFRKFITLRNYLTDPDFKGINTVTTDKKEIKKEVKKDIKTVEESPKFTLFEPIEELRLQYEKQIEDWGQLIAKTKIKLEALRELESLKR